MIGNTVLLVPRPQRWQELYLGKSKGKKKRHEGFAIPERGISNDFPEQNDRR
jgi:hypothetical protein